MHAAHRRAVSSSSAAATALRSKRSSVGVNSGNNVSIIVSAADAVQLLRMLVAVMQRQQHQRDSAAQYRCISRSHAAAATAVSAIKRHRTTSEDVLRPLYR